MPSRLNPSVITISLLAILLLAEPASARVRLNDLNPGRNVNLPDWSNGGDITINIDFCVASYSGTGGGTTPLPYKIRAYHSTAGEENLPFRLENIADPTQDIPVSMTFVDLLGSSTETLTANTFTAQDKTGALNNCPAGLNGRIIFTMTSVDLLSVFSGNYKTRYRIQAVGGVGGTEDGTGFFTINLTIVTLMQISGLNDLVMPPFTGANNLVANDSFCVYRNSTGTYSATLSGSGTGGAFTITNGTNPIPYTVTWNDLTATSTATANVALTGRQNVFYLNTDCNAGANNNGTAEVTILATDLSIVPMGIYTGTLTILVAPE